MNKRMKRKMQKQIENAAPVVDRVQNEIKGTAKHVLAEIKQEVVARAGALEKTLEKLPLIGTAAAHKVAELKEKLSEKSEAPAH